MPNTDLTLAPLADPVAASRSHRRRAWTVTGLLVAFMMVNFADKSVLGLAADRIRHDLGLSATGFGLANSAFFLLFSLSGALGGLLADRVRPRWLLLGMAVAWSLTQTPMALGGGVAALVVSRIVLGAAEGPAFPVAQHTALAWFPDHRRNLPGALISVGVTLGVVLAAPGLTWVIEHHGWRAAFAVVAVVGVVWAAAWAALGKDRPARADDPAGGSARDSADDPVNDSADVAAPRPAELHGADAATSPAPSYRRILATRTWIGATVGYFGTYWMIALSLVWVPSYLKDGLGYSASASAAVVAGIWAVNGVALLAQAAATGWLLRRGVGSRWARGRLGGITLLVSAAGCGVLSQTGRGPLTVLLLLVGFGLSGAMSTVAVTSVAELVPQRRRGGALGLMNAAVTLAGLVAPALTGYLIDLRGGAGYGNAVVLAAVLLAVGGVAAVALIDPAADARRLAR
ncbi:MFS transporter [Streptomyces mangrovisoli]|uniref:MFS transporter n=1 Tax=Streptomyces mangrovisoli TaxID=1428628 RepID=A0A1J4NSC3_9ACTN|nr:MFS transporter [Streptomyces mangrovisoli]OIJ65369.1 MFS transporter [Streptomyces mangrovisoli]